MTMHKRVLGRQGLTTSALGLGTMGMTMFYGPSNREENITTIRRAFDLGVTLFDTAEVYGGGTGSNERLLGEAVKGFRDEVVLATKFGYDLANPGGLDSRPDNIRTVADNSLRYLGTDHIDVLYQHRVDPDVPIEEVAGTVKELIEAGKVCYLGLSEAGPETIRRAHAVQPVSVLQTEYSVFERHVEDTVLPVVRELGIGFVPYAPLGRGFLTGAMKPADQYTADDWRRRDPRWQGENFDANAQAVAALTELASSKGITTAQLALAWLLAQGDDIVPIPGTRSPERLAENIGATGVTLTAHDLARIKEILPNGAFGDRYAAPFMPKG
ncbi:aldo/keto reductase [Streptomyces morookaense]|uniref:aldo/keto reductase n=1 Tax=Streptomyces morookaense TaxID=1970 RepID=UPI003F4D2658